MSSYSSPGGRSTHPPDRLPPGLFPFFRHTGTTMNHQIQLFQIDRDAKPTDAPRPTGVFEVAADTIDGARAAAIARLTDEGKTIRSLSFLADGGFAVVLTEPPPAPSAAQVRRAKGGR